MSEDMDRIFEISLNKIEHSKSRKVYGKSNMLHRTLLVNTVINRVRNSERTFVHKNELQTTFMNYREPKSIVDIDDYDTEKTLTYTECQTRCRNHANNTNIQKKKISSLVTLLNARSLCGKVDDSLTKKYSKDDHMYEGKENITHIESYKYSNDTQRRLLHEKRHSSNTLDGDDQPCPKKKLRCIWPSNVTPCIQDVNYSITGLASLFGDLVANSDAAEKSNMALNSNFATAMVAC